MGREICAMAGVDKSTISRWARENKIKGTLTNDKKSLLLIDEDSLKAHLATQQWSASAQPQRSDDFLQLLQETLERERERVTQLLNEREEIKTELRQVRVEMKEIQVERNKLERELRAYISGETDTALTRWMKTVAASTPNDAAKTNPYTAQGPLSRKEAP